MPNLFNPYLMTIAEIKDETPDIKTFRLKFANENEGKAFNFKAGQFAEYSVFGEGECTFCIASSPTRPDHIECSFKVIGKVTNALARKDIGDTIGFRGPYGNSFPIEEMFGKNLVFIGGGIGLAPLRSLIWNCLDMRDKFKDILIIYGARTVADLVYKDELEQWKKVQGVKLITTVDPGGETPDWKGKVGFVPKILDEAAPSAKDTVAITCGPPIMIKFVLKSLEQLGFSKNQVVTTLENRMKCGFGKCGRCNIGSTYVCIDGPVFTAKQLAELPEDF